MLTLKNIKKKYKGLEVLKGIDLEVQRGEIVSIVGASGAGKSTLLHIAGTLEKPDEGEIIYNNTQLNKYTEKALARFRNQKVGFVFQFHNLLPEFNAFENICMPGFIGEKNEKTVKDRAHELMDILGIRNRETHKPNELSGGEQQRTAVARALLNDPDIIFADEPSGNLDSVTAEELHNLFLDLRKRLSQTFVIVTHNDHLANLADRKLEILDGIIKK